MPGLPEDCNDPAMTSTVTLGVDIGGTKVLVAAVRFPASEGSEVEGIPLEVIRTLKRPVRADVVEVTDDVTAAVREVLALLESTGELPAGMGIGVAGLVDRSGVVRRSPNVAGVDGRDLGELLHEATGLPTVVANDANCVAVAAQSALHPTPGHLLALTFGTGIGGGLISSGELQLGDSGYALEPGHMVVVPGGVPCGCGQRGCWERYASGPAISRAAENMLSEGLWTAPTPSSAPAPGGPISSEEVIALARQGDESALAVVGDFAEWMSFGLANLIQVLDPGRIVISGGLAQEADLFLDDVVKKVGDNPQLADHHVEISVAPWGSNAGAIGAALLARSAGLSTGSAGLSTGSAGLSTGSAVETASPATNERG